MKNLFYSLFILMLFSCNKKSKIEQITEISCGQCNFGLTSEEGCTLAVKIDNKAYFVESFDIDDFGDAHDEHTGFCSVIRKAKINGELVDGKFLATKIELVK